MGPPPEHRRYEHRAMGAWNVLQIADPEPGDPDAAGRAAAAAFQLLDRLEDELSRFRPESNVCQLNALGAGGPVGVGRALFEILVVAKAAWEVTGGAFDPTVGPLMDAWGFPRGPARVPSEEEIEALLTRRGMDHLILDPAAGTARFDLHGVAIDLGAVGKGYAADRVTACLRGRGVGAGVFIAGSSSISMWGRPAAGGAWRVEVTHPLRPEDSIREIEAEAGSVSTSGAYQDHFVEGGVEYGHILDPRTGRPVRSATRSVTVWTPEAIQGDILSTALFVLGREGGERLFRERLAPRGVRASALIIEEDPRAEGGLAVAAIHSGEPGFREMAAPGEPPQLPPSGGA
jgi:FAD:protein FMN transferase